MLFISHSNLFGIVKYFYVFQRAVFKHFEELQKFAFANVASIDTREALQSHFSTMRYVESDAVPSW